MSLSLPGNISADAELAAEQEKFRRKRQEAEDRRNRFLSPRNRTIGVDVSALNDQVAESKKVIKEIENEKKLDRMRNKEIDLIMEAIDEEQRKMKQFYMQEIKKSWKDSKNESKSGMTPSKEATSPDDCGPSSLQKFAGEDPTRDNRILHQKEQMRQWIQEKVAEMAQISIKTKQDHDEYSQLIQAVDRLREETELDEKMMRDQLNRYVVEENKVLAEEQKEKRRQWNKIGPGFNGRSILSDLDDNIVPAVVNGSKIAHKDAFRGLTKAQQFTILKQNDDIINEKREAERERKAKEDEYAKHSQHVQRAMDILRFQEDQMKAEETAAVVSTLKAQVDEHKKRTEASRKDKYGSVNEGFFSSFGASCR